MQPPDSNEGLRTRRKVLGAMVSSIPAAALLGLNSQVATASAAPEAVGMETHKMPETSVPEEFLAQARLRSYKNRRSSSWDRTGGNADAVPVEPGQTAKLLEVDGAGVVTHLWFTINSPDPMHLKNLILRAWWDGEATPSIEVPIGDFFGLGLGQYFTYQSAMLAVAPIKALNAYFQMPFARWARITLTNEGKVRTDNLYFAIDYVTFPALPAGVGRFHAQYRQAAPCVVAPGINNGKNLTGANNYVFLEAAGKGHFVGLTHSVVQNKDGWFGEGDDMIIIDGDPLVTINGTGTEDYYNGAWDFAGQAFAFMHNGAPYMVNPEKLGGRYCLYRWHIESPIAFEKSIRVTIEHGTANDRSDSFYSTAYWYQTEPHAAFPALPAAADRVPQVPRA
jgi:hypothetical protein